MKKKVSLSKSVKIMTAIFLPILFIADLSVLVTAFSNNDEILVTIMMLSLFLIISVSIFSIYAYSPRYITVSDSHICLYRGIGKVQIKYSDITDFGIFNNKEFAARTFGIGGIFGYTGKFYTKTLGNHTEYVGNYSQAFYLILRNGKKYVFSCEDRDTVLKELKDKIGA